MAWWTTWVLPRLWKRGREMFVEGVVVALSGSLTTGDPKEFRPEILN